MRSNFFDDDDQNFFDLSRHSQGVVYECMHCRSTIVRRSSDSAPFSCDGGPCVDWTGRDNHGHMWMRRS